MKDLAVLESLAKRIQELTFLTGVTAKEIWKYQFLRRLVSGSPEEDEYIEHGGTFESDTVTPSRLEETRPEGGGSGGGTIL